GLLQWPHGRRSCIQPYHYTFGSNHPCRWLPWAYGRGTSMATDGRGEGNAGVRWGCARRKYQLPKRYFRQRKSWQPDGQSVGVGQ
ncbi:MAG: hypothetical protein ABR954_10655, partial [Dehalococcoidales bacterium]